MNPNVKAIKNNTDAELIVKNDIKATSESVSPHSMKELIDENLLDLTFVSETKRPIYIRIQSISGDGGVGDGEDAVVVEAGDPEGEEEI